MGLITEEVKVINNKIINPITGRYMEDLTNNKYGRLTVLGVDFEKMKSETSKGRKYSYWRCECNCGSNKITSVSIGALKSGRIQSCGCSRKRMSSNFKDLTGEHYGRLTVLSLNKEISELHRENGCRDRYWNCICECENTCVINGHLLTSDKQKSCGCIQKENLSSYFIKKALSGNSIGHFIIEMFGEDKLYSVWDLELNNNMNPFEINKGNNTQEIYIKCINNLHKSYKTLPLTFVKSNGRCPECSRERSESFLQEKVRLYLEDLNYNILHERNCDIIPINPKTKYALPFDNQVLELNFIIEVMGIQHYSLTNFHNLQAKNNGTTPEYELHYIKLKDKYKKMYAKSKGYNYIAIPYWTDDKDETWKKLINENINIIKGGG
jgi:hypothetical protein